MRFYLLQSFSLLKIIDLQYLTELTYCPHCVLYKDVLSFVFQTFEFQVLCFGFCVLCHQKFETQNSKHLYTKHNVPMGSGKEK